MPIQHAVLSVSVPISVPCGQVLEFADGRPACVRAVVSRATALGTALGSASAAASDTASAGVTDVAEAVKAAGAATASEAASPRAASSAADPVVIIGGGIGGLAVAVALQARGVACHVYERDGGWDLERRGYGLTLGPTCAAALTSLGLGGAVQVIALDDAWMIALDDP